MSRTLECDCGHIASGADEAELVAAVQRHAREAHDMDIPAELILEMARLRAAQPGLTADPGTTGGER